MTYLVKIRNNKTGEIRLCKFMDYDWDETQLFWWKEGNGRCDCNRSICFHNDNDIETPCELYLKDQTFHVLCAVLEDGTEVPIDDVK